MSRRLKNALAHYPMTSDLTIVCEGRGFKVHKLIVLPRSSVIATMFKHNTIERQTNIITTIRSIAVQSHVGSPSSTARCTGFSTHSSVAGTGSPKPQDLHDGLVEHARVYAIAEYYGADEL